MPVQIVIGTYLAILVARLTASVAAKHIAAIVAVIIGRRTPIDGVAERYRAAIGEEVLDLKTREKIIQNRTIASKTWVKHREHTEKQNMIA